MLGAKHPNSTDPNEDWCIDPYHPILVGDLKKGSATPELVALGSVQCSDPNNNGSNNTSDARCTYFYIFELVNGV